MKEISFPLPIISSYCGAFISDYESMQ